MLSRLIISSSRETQLEQVSQLLKVLDVPNPHPDLLWIEPEKDKSLGVKDAKKIREHLSFKPHSAKGKVVVMVGADTLSIDAQNSLLKTLEEPPASASIILTAETDKNLLATILSRVEVIKIQDAITQRQEEYGQVEKLFKTSIEERFQIIEKTEDREGLFQELIEYTAEKLPENQKLLGFAKEVSEAEKFYKHQGNIRTILEYLALCMDTIQS